MPQLQVANGQSHHRRLVQLASNFFVGLNPADAESLGLAEGDNAKVSQSSAGSAELPVRITNRIPKGAAWLKSGTCGTRELGASMGTIDFWSTADGFRRDVVLTSPCTIQ